MIFNRRITFVSLGEGERYDPVTGGWIEAEAVKVTKPCNLSNLGINRRNELFGDILEEVQVARLQHPHLSEYNHVEVDGVKYKVTQQSNYRKGVLFLVRDENG